MSRVTNEINKVTGTIISLSGKLIIYAVILLLLIEGASRGYAFGHAIFYATAMEAAPGRDKTVTITDSQSAGDTARMLKDMGLVASDLTLQIQMKFYEYKFHPGTYELNTSMTSKEILQVLNEGPQEDESAAGTVRETAAAETTTAAETTPETTQETTEEEIIEIQIN